ncbi:MAG: hypothetical protein AB7P69_25835 [Candidatus Binatia bacterium]
MGLGDVVEERGGHVFLLQPANLRGQGVSVRLQFVHFPEGGGGILQLGRELHHLGDPVFHVLDFASHLPGRVLPMCLPILERFPSQCFDEGGRIQVSHDLIEHRLLQHLTIDLPVRRTTLGDVTVATIAEPGFALGGLQDSGQEIVRRGPAAL